MKNNNNTLDWGIALLFVITGCAFIQYITG